MILEQIECIYVDRTLQTIVTLDQSSQDLTTLAAHSKQIHDTARALTQRFSRVHLCSKASQIEYLLDARSKSSPEATIILVRVEEMHLDELNNVSHATLRTSQDRESTHLTFAQTADTLKGLDLLKHLNYLKRRRKFDCALTAACLDTLQPTLIKAALDSGTDDYVLQSLETHDLERLALLLYKSFSSRRERESDAEAEDTYKYEMKDVIPTQTQWESLQYRVESLYLYDQSPFYQMLDDHMPPYENPRTYKSTRDVVRLQKLVSDWSFSTLELSEDDLIHCAAIILRHVMDLPGAEPWRISDDELYLFLETIRRSYYSTNPYHNFRHAVDVTQAVFFMLLSANAIPAMNSECTVYESLNCPVLGHLLTPQYILAACIVGIGHDVGHPGVNNAFLVTTKAPLALVYNDRSVLENLHCAALSRILMRKWPSIQLGNMRKIVLELILSTDMALHFDYMSRFKDMEALCLSTREAFKDPILASEGNEIPPATLEKHRLTLFSALIKCGDISNVARPFEISKSWSTVLLREFFNQARLEKSMQLPVTKTFDPEETRQADSQVFFMTLFAHPLFTSLSTILPNLNDICTIIKSNRDIWKNGGTRPERPNGSTMDSAETIGPSTTSDGLNRVASPAKVPTPTESTLREVEQQHQTQPPILPTSSSPTKKAFCLPQFLKRKKQP